MERWKCNQLEILREKHKKGVPFLDLRLCAEYCATDGCHWLSHLIDRARAPTT